MELTKYSVSELSRMLSGKEVSSEDLTRAYLKNIEAKEPEIGAYITVTGEEAIAKAKVYIAEKGIGKVKVNYRLRDAIFSRQRYWGEPFPVYYKEGMPYTLDMDKLPLLLPEISTYLPTETGEPPLGRAENWKTEDGYRQTVSLHFM